MATIETISEAIKLIDSKKQSLREAFEELRSHPSSSSFFTSLTWSHLDSHFSSLQSTIHRNFDLLKSQPSIQNPDQGEAEAPPPQPQPRDSAPARPELKSLCEVMDAVGLRGYIMKQRPKERLIVGNELADALKCAPDAGALVLDAVDGFFSSNSEGDMDKESVNVRKASLVIFEGLMGSKVEISAEVRERAKGLAVEWKGKLSFAESNTFEALGFLHLVANYGLVDVFNVDELVDLAVISWKYAQFLRLCRALSFGDKKMSEIIQKLIGKGKIIQAVKCILEFELADKFAPVPLLKEFVNDAKKQAQKIRKDGKHSRQSLNEATTKEVVALTTVINIIEDRKLDVDFWKQGLLKRVEVLETEKDNRHKRGSVSVSKTPQQSKPQNLSGMKRARDVHRPPARDVHRPPARDAHRPPYRSPNSAAFASSTDLDVQLPTIQKAATSTPNIIPFRRSYSAAVPSFANNQSYTIHASSTAPAYQQSHSQLLPSSRANVPNVATASANGPPYQQSYFQPGGLLPDHQAQYLNSQATPYGLADSSTVAPYAGSSHPHPRVYSTETKPGPGYYDGSISYGGYSMPPQHHSSYYPQ